MIARRLMFALVLSLCGSAIFTFWLSRKLSRPAANDNASLHYVATSQALNAGDVLTPAMLKLVSWPTSDALEGAFPRPDAVAGRIVLYPLAAGEPVLERQLASPGSSAGLSMKIPDGMRAISLKSDQVVGVSGFLLPGTHVDVLVTVRTPTTGEAITSTILQDAQIIATGQKMEPDPEGKPTPTDVVTILCLPDQAEKVTLASTLGSVHFILRNGSDHKTVNDGPAKLDALGAIGSSFGALPAALNLKPRNVLNPVPANVRAPAPPPAAAPAPRPYTVEMVYGEKGENGK